MRREEIPGLKNTYVSLLPLELREKLAEKYYGPIEITSNLYSDDNTYYIYISAYTDVGKFSNTVAFGLKTLYEIIDDWEMHLNDDQQPEKIFTSIIPGRCTLMISHKYIQLSTLGSLSVLPPNIAPILIDKFRILVNDVEYVKQRNLITANLTRY